MSKKYSERDDVRKLKADAERSAEDEILYWSFRGSPHDILALIGMIESLEARVDRMKGIISELRGG